MKTGKAGIELIKQFESCRYKAYKLAGEQYYTIGYGHSFDPSINANTVWNQAQAESALKQDLFKFERYVNEAVKFPINQNQFDALVSYTYNRGKGGLNELVKNSPTIEAMSKNIVKYWGKATKYKNGLVKRRKKEQALFNTPTNASTAPSKKLSINEVAREVIDGKWGSGNDRKTRLIQAGYNYSDVQAEVNRILSMK